MTYYIDESVKKLDSSEICALIAIKTVDSGFLKSLLRKSMAEIIADPILSQHNGINSEWVPHFCNDHPYEVHSTFLRSISLMPFESHIVFGHKDKFQSTNEYDWYDHLARVLFAYRLAADRDRPVKIVFEQHDSKVKKREAQLQTLFNKLEASDAQRRRGEARSISVTSAGKDELLLCLPDYIGGSFMSYLCNNDVQMIGPDRRKYEIISKKIRWIKDLDRKKIYTSKNPYHRD